MKTKLLFLIAFLFTSIFYAQTWEDINFIDQNEESVIVKLADVALDEANNVYIYGSDDLDIEYIQKISPLGEIEWAKNISSYIDYFGTLTDSGIGSSGLVFNNGDLYAVGSKNNRGVIIKTGVSENSLIEEWEVLSQDEHIINDIKINGDYLYIVGTFGNANTASSNIEFSNGELLTGSYKSTFVAKYSLSQNQLLWAKKIDGINEVKGEALDVDALGNIFIAGSFKGSLILYDGTDSTVFNSSQTNAGFYLRNAFLTKLKPDGNFDTLFGFKSDYNSQKSSFEVNVSDINGAVYWSFYEHIRAYNKNGEGNLFWDKEVPSLETQTITSNGCGDVYVGGSRFLTNQGNGFVTTPEFLGLSLASDTGSTVWSQAPTTTHFSHLTKILISNNNGVIFVGRYFTTSNNGGGSFIIEDYASNTDKGIFIGRYNDSAVNNCCANAPELSVNIPSKINICNENFQEICAPDPGTYIYEWSNSDNEILSTESCFTPTEYDLYTLQIINSNGCVITLQSFDIVNAQGAVNPIEDIYYCKKVPLTVGFSFPVTNAISYEWTFNGTPITAFNYAIPNQGDGEYCVTVNWANLKLCPTTVCFNVAMCCKETNPDFAHAYNSPVNFMTIQNIPEYVPNYVEEKYFIYKQCNNDTNWVLEFSYIRSGNDMYNLIVVPVDSNCIYKIDHIVKSCDGKKVISTHYVNEKNRVSVSPNPVKDTFEILIKRFNLSDNMSIEIFDNIGLKLTHSSSLTDKGFQINSRNWIPGIYFCKVKVNDNLYTSKIIKN